MSKTNQCMGCQAGWPIDGKKTHREPGAGLVGCTADRYATKPAFKCSVYLDHITEVMNIALVLFRELDARRPLPFSISDILLVVFLHDLEKPWKYEMGEDGHLRHKAAMLTKTDHQRFRMAKLAEYGIVLSVDHENGLKYAEGELEDYSSRERKMSPLAALAHLCDVTSARIWFDHPAIAHDPWGRAARASPPASVPSKEYTQESVP